MIALGGAGASAAGATPLRHADGSRPPGEPEWIFVFGSNLAGRHGAGAALAALQHHGAVRGVGIGRTGASYAIPTKDGSLRVLPLDAIRPHVEAFIRYACEHPELKFFLTRIGTGYAGYSDQDIAPMFRSAPPNCSLADSWAELLGEQDCERPRSQQTQPSPR